MQIIHSLRGAAAGLTLARRLTLPLSRLACIATASNAQSHTTKLRVASHAACNELPVYCTWLGHRHSHAPTHRAPAGTLLSAAGAALPASLSRPHASSPQAPSSRCASLSPVS